MNADSTKHFLAVFLFCAGVSQAQTADLILYNGNIVTLDPARPRAQALAVRGDTIVALGSDAEIRKLAAPQTKSVDLGGQLAVPGFIEGHGHFLGVGEARTVLNLRDAKTWDEIVAMVADAAGKAAPGSWIIGRGWHQAKWTRVPQPNVQGFPIHDSLSRVSPRNPVWLTHASGHAGFANALALEQAGVTRATRDPAGGEIVRDVQGNATGALKEAAQGLVRPRSSSPSRGREYAALAGQECLSKGITSFQDAGNGPDVIDMYRSLAKEGKLEVRLWVMLRAPTSRLAELMPRYRAIDKQVTVRAIKRMIDGALGPRGAWLLAPYSDLPGSTGLNTEDPNDLRRAAGIALANDYQVCVHAIGDRANRETLDIFDRVLAGRRDLRWRIEHAQHISAADIPRFAKLGVIASMQAIHCTSDAPYVLARLGPARAEEGAYVWRSLMRTGAVVTNGTDAPVEDVDPLGSFYAAVTRRLKDGSTFYPGQVMTREEALRSYTIQNAYAAFEEKQKGTLEAGKLADITVLSKDILTVPAEEIPSARVVYTIVGGRIAFSR